jgi:hypothetical protein
MRRIAMRNLIHEIVAFVGLATVSFTSTLPANAEASGDGFRGPIVFTDVVLDQSLEAMNAFLLGRYAQDDKLAAITAPLAKEFREVAVATADIPSMVQILQPPTDELPVENDDALDSSITYSNAERSSGSGILFFSHTEVQVHKAFDFIEIADGLAQDRSIYSLEVVPTSSGTEFGGPVNGAQSLDVHMVALNAHIEELATRDGLLNFNPPPPMTQISFDAYATAMMLSYN